MRPPKGSTNPNGPRLGEVLDAIQDLVATFDHEGRLLVLNAAGRLLLGLPLDEELSGWLLSDLLPEDEAERFVDEVLPEAIASGEWSGRAELRGSHGATLPVGLRMVAHPPRTDAVRGFTLVARETATSAPLRDTEPDEVDLLLQVLHDVNNLLSPILAHTELAAEELSPASPAGRRLELIQRAAESARDTSAAGRQSAGTAGPPGASSTSPASPERRWGGCARSSRARRSASPFGAPARRSSATLESSSEPSSTCAATPPNRFPRDAARCASA